MGLWYVFVKVFKLQYSMVVMTCSFMRFWYKFISLTCIQDKFEPSKK